MKIVDVGSLIDIAPNINNNTVTINGISIYR